MNFTFLSTQTNVPEVCSSVRKSI